MSVFIPPLYSNRIFNTWWIKITFITKSSSHVHSRGSLVFHYYYASHECLFDLIVNKHSLLKVRTRMYCTALYCIALHCITLQYIALHCIALHCIALHCIALRCTMHCIALHCIALHCIALHCIALHCIVYCIALHCIALHCIALHCIALHYIGSVCFQLNEARKWPVSYQSIIDGY